jgi:release factor glutamine methyltransferase
VFAEEEADLLLQEADGGEQLEQMVALRTSGVPLEHVVGWAEFHGLRITVHPGVFVPRPRTEFLVDQAAALARAGCTVVDLCCGSGALGVAVANAVTGINLHATDIDGAAVACARRNVEPAGGQVYAGDLFEPLPPSIAGCVDLLLANAPYVPSSDVATMPQDAREHEPLVALDGGSDGLDIHRRVAEAARRWLAPDGTLLIEVTAHQAPVAEQLFADAGLHASVASCDELDATVVIGRRPAAD